MKFGVQLKKILADFKEIEGTLKLFWANFVQIMRNLFINVKKSRYPYFLIRCWLQLFTTNERSSYFEVYAYS